MTPLTMASADRNIVQGDISCGRSAMPTSERCGLLARADAGAAFVSAGDVKFESDGAVGEVASAAGAAEVLMLKGEDGVASSLYAVASPIVRIARAMKAVRSKTPIVSCPVRIALQLLRSNSSEAASSSRIHFVRISLSDAVMRSRYSAPL